MRRLAVFGSIALLCALCFLPVLRAQDTAITSRVAGPADESLRITLRGSLSVAAQPEFDRGEASPATELHNVRLVIQRSAQQVAALDKLMAEQLDRSSPNYHRWLTPAQFNKLYGLADSDAAAIELWLQSHGLKVESVTATDIAFSGSVPRVEEALRTSIHTFVTPSGEQFLSNTTEPTIPAAFSKVISGIAFLSTLQPRSYAVHGPSGKYDSQAQRLAPVDSAAIQAHPDLTVNGSFLYVVPADAATIYDTPNNYNLAFTSGTSYTGTGATIGIGGDSNIQTSTVVSYRKRFLNGDTTAPTVIDAGAASGFPAQVNADEDEAYLDNEVSGGLAPGAAIDFYVADRQTAGGIATAIPKMLADNKVDIFSLSFGLCELYLTTGDNQEIAGWWQQAATQGITVVVSTGDDGSAGCDIPGQAHFATTGLNVSGFSTTPYNVAVGGTDFYGLLNGGFSTYVNSNQSSANFYRSALKYIPESTWNDSTTVNGQISTNVPTTSGGQTNIIGGTGGKSNCSSNTTTYPNGTLLVGTCTSGYSKPSWQTGAGVPGDGARDVPDVSLLAANGFYGATWLVCTDDVVQGTAFTESCTTESNNSFYVAGIGGTSASTPALAGILALVVQASGGRLGHDGAKFLYDIYNGSSGAIALHDITQGNNSVPCTSGTPDCQAVGSSFFLKGYNTNAGYDLATGLGSVDATKLIAAYTALSGGKLTPTVTVTPASNSVTITQSLNVTVTVSGGSGNPTPIGTVTLSSGSYTSAATSLTSGSATINIPANSLTAGSATLTAAYAGDTNYNGANGSAPLTVNTKPTPTVTVTPASNSIMTTQSLLVAVKVAGTSGTPTGTVTLSSGSYTSAATALVSGSASITIPANSLGAGTDTLSASYSGDTTYGAASGAGQVTVSKLTPTVTVNPASSSINTGQSLNATVMVRGGVGNPTPSGTVTLTAGSYTSAATALDGTGNAGFSIPSNSFTGSGSGNILASYSGDVNYNAASGNSTLTLTQSTFTVAATTPSAVNHASGATSTTSAITVATTNNYAGLISLTCALTTSPTGASDLPTCQMTNGGQLTFSSTTTSGTAVATVNITQATSSSLDRRGLPGWLGASGGTALALLVFLGMPTRRRSWRSLLGLLIALAALGTLSACGGGGGNGGGGGGGNSGTTAGTYTFTVTGNGVVGSAVKATFTVTVN